MILIIVDKKIPDAAKKKLLDYGELMELETKNITYEAISGHPDIFFCQANEKLIVAPNLPFTYKNMLIQYSIDYLEGEMEVGKKYPETATYNVVYSDDLLIHNFRYTDSIITDIAEDADLIHVDQGYTRCNLIPLKNNNFITSDKGIDRVLKRFDKKVLCVEPKSIILPGFANGFIGGCCGIYEQKVFITGSLDKFSEGDKITSFLTSLGYEIVELYDGPVVDGGSIMFIKS